MKQILIVMSVVMILMPVFLIIERFAGWNIIPREDYYILTLIFLSMVFFYKKEKSTGKE